AAARDAEDLREDRGFRGAAGAFVLRRLRDADLRHVRGESDQLVVAHRDPGPALRAWRAPTANLDEPPPPLGLRDGRRAGGRGTALILPSSLGEGDSPQASRWGCVGRAESPPLERDSPP